MSHFGFASKNKAPDTKYELVTTDVTIRGYAFSALHVTEQDINDDEDDNHRETTAAPFPRRRAGKTST